MPNLQPFYSISEIAILTGKKYDAARRMMNRLHVKTSKIGKLVVYYISDIKEAAPSFYESMKEVILFSDQIEIFATDLNSSDLMQSIDMEQP